MNASYQKDREFNNGILIISAKNENEMEKVEKVVALLVSEGYEDIAGEDDCIILGIPGTIAEAKKDYINAKRAAL